MIYKLHFKQFKKISPALTMRIIYIICILHLDKYLLNKEYIFIGNIS